jgi:phage shock protein A
MQVAPKRAALAAAQESLDKTLGELASAQARLVAVQEKIATLEAQYEEATAKKATLAAQVGAAVNIHHRLQPLGASNRHTLLLLLCWPHE